MSTAQKARKIAAPSGAQKAKVFRNGRSQAVRIPAEFRFKSDEVYVRRDNANGDLILSEAPPRPSIQDIREIFRELDEAGAADFELDRDLSEPIEREWL